MDPELKKALDALGMTQSAAIEAQEKAHKAFTEANDANLKRRDTVTDEKLAKIQNELEKFEPLSKALTEAAAREATAAEERKAQQEQLDRIETKVNRPGAADEAAVDQAKARRAGFINFCRYGADRMTEDQRKNVLQVSDDTGGGYLAPPDYLLEIIKAVQQYSPMRDFARVITTSQKTVQMPKRTGVSAAVWAGEIETRNETLGLAYGMEDTPVHELVADVRFSMANLEDSAFDLEAEVRAEFAEQFGVAEGTAFVLGASNKKPEGFTIAAGTNAINSLAAADVTADGVLDLKHSVKTAYAKNGAFVMNRKTLRNVRKLKDGTGQYLWMPGLAQGRPNSIDGDPYAEFPDMADPASSAKIMAYGDWKRGYMIVDRLAMAVIRDGLTLASNGQVKFIARRRVGGQVILAEAISIMTCSASANA